MNKQLLASLLVVAASPAFAASVSPRVAQIFDKNNRKLSPPPKTQTADPDVRAGRKALPEETPSYSRSAGGRHRRVAQADSLDVSVPGALTADDGDSSSEAPSIDRPREASRSTARRPSRRALSSAGRDRVLGLGLVGVGAYGLFGAELEISLTQEWSFGFGIGTGLSYSSWGAYARYYFAGNGSLQPFGQFGYSNWHVGKTNARNNDIRPNYLAERFFENEAGVVPSDTTAHLLYPAIGVLYQHKEGLAFAAQLLYFVSAPSFQGAPGGGLSFYYYF